MADTVDSSPRGHGQAVRVSPLGELASRAGRREGPTADAWAKEPLPGVSRRGSASGTDNSGAAMSGSGAGVGQHPTVETGKHAKRSPFAIPKTLTPARPSRSKGAGGDDPDDGSYYVAIADEVADLSDNSGQTSPMSTRAALASEFAVVPWKAAFARPELEDAFVADGRRQTASRGAASVGMAIFYTFQLGMVGFFVREGQLPVTSIIGVAALSGVSLVLLLLGLCASPTHWAVRYRTPLAAVWLLLGALPSLVIVPLGPCSRSDPLFSPLCIPANSGQASWLPVVVLTLLLTVGSGPLQVNWLVTMLCTLLLATVSAVGTGVQMVAGPGTPAGQVAVRLLPAYAWLYVLVIMLGLFARSRQIGQRHQWAAMKMAGRAEAETRQALTQKLKAERQKTAAEAEKAGFERVMRYVCHELRNPLHGILGLLEEVRAQPMAADWVVEDLDMCVGSATQMSTILNDVLDLGQLQRGAMELNPVPACVHRLVKACVTPLQSLSQVGITTNISSEVPPRLLLDPLRFSQVVTNGVSNAAKLTKHGNVNVRITYSAGHLLVEVLDTGGGLHGVDGNALFVPYSQGKSRTTSTRFDKGTGLGLAIAAQIVQLMEGAIGLEDRSDGVRGARFWFRVPLPLVSPSAEEVPPVRGRLFSPESEASMAQHSYLSPTTLASEAKALGASGRPSNRLRAIDGPSSMTLGGATTGGSTVPGAGSASSLPPVLPPVSARRSSASVASSRRGSGSGAGSGSAAVTATAAAGGGGVPATITVPAASFTTASLGGSSLGASSASLYDSPMSAAASAPGLGGRARGRVIVCDDEEINRRILKRHLRKAGYEVILMDDGEQLLNLISSSSRHGHLRDPEPGRPPIAAVFLDIMMERTNGEDVCRALRAAGINTPLVAATGNGLRADVRRYEEVFTAVMLKPFSAARVRGILERLPAPSFTGGGASSGGGGSGAQITAVAGSSIGAGAGAGGVGAGSGSGSGSGAGTGADATPTASEAAAASVPSVSGRRSSLEGASAGGGPSGSGGGSGSGSSPSGINIDGGVALASHQPRRLRGPSESDPDSRSVSGGDTSGSTSLVG